MTTSHVRIKLCLILHAPLGGGAERFMINMVNHLNRDKFKISFILLNAQGEYTKLLPNDINIIDLQMPLPGPYQITNPRWILKLANIFHKIQPQIIFSTLGYTNLMATLAKMISGTKAQLVLRETKIVSPYLNKDKWAWFKKMMYAWCYSKANLISGPTDAVIDDLQTFINISNTRTRVIPNFIDQRFIKQKKLEPVPFKKYNLKMDKSIIISVGHLEKVKGIDIALEALKSLLNKIDCYYWILGTGKEEERLKTFVKENCMEKHVYFLGFQENPYAFLNQSDIFLLPSRSEGFPNALLEAMACDIPCVVTHYNNSIDKFITNEKEGIIVPTEDPTTMCHALKSLLKDSQKSQKLKKLAKLTLKQYYLENVIVQYEQLFNQLLKK